jgi:hypothetical protein
MSPQPSVGRIVHYTLNEDDAAAINVRRTDFEAFQRNHPHPHEPGQYGASGHQAHVGNQALASQVYPAVVVRVFPDANGACNLQVLLDGNDAYWATSRTEGEEPGRWSWPPRV